MDVGVRADVSTDVSAADISRLYESYLDACNERDWERLGSLVHDRVTMNGLPRSRQEYVDDIRRTTSVFDNYTWSLQRVVLQPPWLAVHLHDRGRRVQSFLGAPGDGSAVETDEFVMYRFEDERIHEVWGIADNARLRR